MIKRISLIGLIGFLASQGISQNLQIERFHFGFSAGFGFPKVPLSQFRAPISVLGGGFVNYRFTRRVGLQLNGCGLHTYSLGTASNRDEKLRFDLKWASTDLLWHIGGVILKESFVALGMGCYRLSQQFEDDEDMLDTTGLSLGLINWGYHPRLHSVLEMRWHLLFHPKNNPQVVTITFGILL